MILFCLGTGAQHIVVLKNSNS